MNSDNIKPNHQIIQQQEIGIIKFEGFIKRRIGVIILLILLITLFYKSNILLLLFIILMLFLTIFSLFSVIKNKNELNYYFHEIISNTINILFLIIFVILQLTYKITNISMNELYFFSIPILFGIHQIHSDIKEFKNIKELAKSNIYLN